MKKKFLNRGILVITALAFATLLNAQQKTSDSSAKKTGNRTRYLYIENEVNSVPGQKIINYRDKQEYKIKMMNDKVTELIIDDNKIPEADFYKYDSAIKKIREQVKKDEEMAELDRKAAEKDREMAEKDREMAEKDEVQSRKDREQAEEDRKMAAEDMKQAMADREQAKKDNEQAEEDRQQSAKDREQAKLDRKQAEEDRALLKNLVDDLIKENIIKDEKDLSSIQLNERELSVNGKKQPEAVYRKFKTKYLNNPRTEIWFSNSIHHRGLSVQ